MIGEELVRRSDFKTAIQVFSLLLKSKHEPRILIQRAKCYQNEKLFVEAARDLTEASSIAPNMYASLSGQ